MTDRHYIHLRDMKLICSVGVYAHEKRNPQPILLNLTLEVSHPAKLGDNVKNILSYGDVAEVVREVTLGKHYQLLETLAAKILDRCFEHPMVIGGELQIEKPHIFADIDAVGITMTRSRE